MNEIDPNDLIMGSGAKSASFPKIGTTISGTVSRPPETMQQTDIKTREPLTYSDGNPKYLVRVLLMTEEHEDADDTGERALYVKVGGGLMNAIREALKAAGATKLEVGGKLLVRYSGDGVAKGALDPPKLYQAKYKVPVGAAAPNGQTALQVPDETPQEVDLDEIPF